MTEVSAPLNMLGIRHRYGSRQMTLSVIGVYTIQQTSSISMSILNTFAGSLLDVFLIM